MRLISVIRPSISVLLDCLLVFWTDILEDKYVNMHDTVSPEMDMGWVHPWVGLGLVGAKIFSFWWVGLGCM